MNLIIIPSLYFIFLLAFLGNSLSGYGLIPNYLLLINEICIYILFLYSLIYKRKLNQKINLDLWWPIFIFISIGILSLFINYRFDYSALNSFRRVLRFWFLYWALVNLSLNERFIRIFNIFLFIMLLVQIPVVIIKFHFYGISELTMGTYTVRGGGLSTLLPIVAIGYFLSYYFLYRRNFLLILGVIGYIFYGIASAKRALLFLFPMFSFLGYYLIFFKKGTVKILKCLIATFIILILSISLSLLIIKLNPTLNPERKVGGTIDFNYVFNYVKNYITHKNERLRIAGSRWGTTTIVVETLFSGNIENILVGFGPGVLVRSALEKNKKIPSMVESVARSYGLSSFAFLLIEYGISGALSWFIIFFIFFKRTLSFYFNESDLYWRSFATGTVIFIIITLFYFFYYNVLAILGDLLPPAFYYSMALVNQRLKRV